MSETLALPTGAARPTVAVRAVLARHVDLVLFAVLAAIQLAFGMWLSSRGFQWGDAYSRSVNALLTLHSTDPHLAAIGFIWMPLPTLLQIPWMLLYPAWPDVVQSGFALSITTAMAGGATAVILLRTARALGLSTRIGVFYALLVAINPMLFLFSTNGDSEGVAAPGFVGAVCCVLLFWRTGERLYVLWGGLALAWAFGCVYEAAVFGAALFVVLVGGILWRSKEVRRSNPQGPWRAVEGLGLVFLLPSAFFGCVWVIANATITGDPLYFANAQYSTFEQNKDLAAAGSAGPYELAGDIVGSLGFAAERSWPFLIPIALILVVRALDRRFWRAQTASLLLLVTPVSFGLMVFLIYQGETIGYLRYFMYPLFVGAAWGLYEIAASASARRASALVLAGWVLAIPATAWAMHKPNIGRELESAEISSLWTGASGNETPTTRDRLAHGGNPRGFVNVLSDNEPLAHYLNVGPLTHATVLADSVAAWPVAPQIRPSFLRHRFILSTDQDFKEMARNPWGHHVGYVLVPDPSLVPADEIVRIFPRLWKGQQPGFRLVRSFPEAFNGWRVFRVFPPGTDPQGSPNDQALLRRRQ